MAKQPLPTPAELRQMLRYEPETGKLYWLERPLTPGHRGAAVFNAMRAGKEAFTFKMPTGHMQGRVHGRGLLAHRVIWAVVYGDWPTGEVDHINGDPTDNRLANLRDVPHQANQQNLKRPSHNTSGIAGVRQRGKRWTAEIKVDGKNRSLGTFAEMGDAVKARQAALVEHGFHPNHGRG